MDMRDILSSNLKLLRKRSGLTQAELAEKCDLSEKGYQQIERSLSWPSWNSIEKISNALNCSPNDLFDYEKPITPLHALNTITELLRGPAGDIISALSNLPEDDVNDIRSALVGMGALTKERKESLIS